MNKQEQDQLIQDNRKDIEIIKHSIKTIETNHLAHVEKSLDSLDKRITRIDGRMWLVLMMIIGSAVLPYIVEKLI